MKKFTVQGSGEFPFDMLRFDRCFPTSPAASLAMGYFPDGRGRTMREVELCTDECSITPARWESFGWRVTQGG